MPVHETTVYYAECDECDWGTDDLPERDQADTLLDKHIRDEH